ncbi:hypothetical protein, partial [Candidatus Electronema sp. TJ]|uniref:hypothetical protein n=1 Tax=Candidatus Electronema sp. TJ TaxID=3401573 RepID=UPI003AA82F5E
VSHHAELNCPAAWQMEFSVPQKTAAVWQQPCFAEQQKVAVKQQPDQFCPETIAATCSASASLRL